MDGIQNERIISQYTRAQAIEDGQLIDISNWTMRAGIKFPVAVSRLIWFAVIANTEISLPSRMVRLGRFVAKLRDEIRKGDGDRINFEISDEINGDTKTFAMYATLLSGDNFEPVITVAMRDED